MSDYSSTYDNDTYRTSAPWGTYYNSIQTVVIETGVTSIGSFAFHNCTSLTSITIPSSVTSIGGGAFYGCSSLKLVHYAGTETDWNKISIGSDNTGLTEATKHYLHYQDGSGEWYCPICDEYFYGKPFTGNEYCRLGDITLKDASGNTLQTVPTGKSLVTIPVTNLKSTQGSKVMLAAYNDKGQFDGVLWVQINNVPVDSEIEVTVPLDNTSGEIKTLKAFVLSADGATPQGNAVTFGE